MASGDINLTGKAEVGNDYRKSFEPANCIVLTRVGTIGHVHIRASSGRRQAVSHGPTRAQQRPEEVLVPGDGRQGGEGGTEALEINDALGPSSAATPRLKLLQVVVSGCHDV
jgi:hypothetical protein